MRELYERLAGEVGKVVIGQDDVVRGVVTGLAVGGHVLLEGPPGVAKTLLASAVARALGLEFRRVQFTPDMLPSDLTGTSTLRAGELAFRPGPIFANLVLADEINRTPPKTQAALLEAMQEGQVSVDGASRRLPDPFLVVGRRVPHRDPQEEPVQLRLGQRVRALVLDRVLGGEHDEGALEVVGVALRRDLALLHGLEEGGLGLRGGPVDLVAEQQAGEYRPRAEVEAGGALVEHR